MRANKAVLCATQGEFIDYIKKENAANNRIIFYRHDGHFGAGFAITSTFKKIHLLTFSELKKKTGKNIGFRLLYIVAAVGTFILNTVKNVDVRVTINSILDNTENIYLGIDQSKKYLKYLNLKKFPHRYASIKYIVFLEDHDIHCDEDIEALKLICKLIRSRKLTNTLLLISGEQIKRINMGFDYGTQYIPFFKLSDNDLDFIAQKNNIKFNQSMRQNVEIIRKLGIQFFIDNCYYFEALSEKNRQSFDWTQKMDWIISQIIHNHDVLDDKIYPLLEFASFFENSFTKIAIQNFNENQLKAENLEIVSRLSIIEREKPSFRMVPTYYYKNEPFKDYFSTKYVSDLQPMPKLIFDYFRIYFPFEYLPALKILQIDSSIEDYKTKQSLVVCGYYHKKNVSGIANGSEFLCFTSKESTSSDILNLYECFKNDQPEFDQRMDLTKTISNLCMGALDTIATCIGYTIILQFLKENYVLFPQIKFSDVLASFCSKILEISASDDRYSMYWQGHFKCQYIAFTLEDEKTDNLTARRFMNDIQLLQKDENMLMYIKENNLRDFSRIDLLAFSLSHDNADKILSDLFKLSETSTIIKELARINYSAYLIENEYFNEAEKVLQSVELEFLQNINMDTYCGYLNNLYLLQLMCGQINACKYIKLLSSLLNKKINHADRNIIINNMATVYLEYHLDNIDYALNLLKEILVTGNPYNQFYAIHNLLGYYFTQNERTLFDDLYDKIFIPKLLKSDTTFFSKKFKWMKNNMGKASYTSFKKSVSTTACYNHLYLLSPIERWFE